jgi:excisionase family DNA binding protein
MITDEEFTGEQLLLTTTQAAKVLSVSRTTVYALINQGELHPVHISRSCRLSWAELERYVQKLDGTPSAAPETASDERRWRRCQTPDGRRVLQQVRSATPDTGPAA